MGESVRRSCYCWPRRSTGECDGHMDPRLGPVPARGRAGCRPGQHKLGQSTHDRRCCHGLGASARAGARFSPHRPASATSTLYNAGIRPDVLHGCSGASPVGPPPLCNSRSRLGPPSSLHAAQRKSRRMVHSRCRRLSQSAPTVRNALQLRRRLLQQSRAATPCMRTIRNATK
jgi:hypothetical protein